MSRKMLVLVLALGFFLGWWLSPGRGVNIQPVPEPSLPACQYEDGPGPCYWDAQTRGNGKGRSFTMDADGEVTYR